MTEDKITLIDDNNEQKDYKLLAIIDKDYKYIIYTDSNNSVINKDLYAIKVKELSNNSLSIQITNDEWNMINDKYMSIIK